MTLKPRMLSKWLLLGYIAGVLGFLLLGADAIDSLVLGVLFSPWIIGPAALAAKWARASPSSGGAWTFLALEAAIVGSTVWLWAYLILIEPDPQNGIAMMFFPAIQYAAAFGTLLMMSALGWRKQERGEVTGSA